VRSLIKLKAPFILTVLVSLVLIPASFKNLSKNISIGENISIALITSNILIYLFIGLICFGFSLLVINHLWPYKAGKLFSLYLMLISICILLINMPLNFKVAKIPIRIIAAASNLVLFNLIGQLTYLNNKKSYRVFRWILFLFSFIQLALSLTDINIGNRFFYIDNYFLTVNYLATVFFILVFLLSCYRHITHHTKKQVKLLLIGLLSGAVIFAGYSFFPIFALVRVSQSEEIHIYIHSAETLSAVLLNRDIQSIIMFTGVVGVIIYILIKREYLIEIRRKFGYIIYSTLYLIIVNIMLFYSYSPMPSSFYYIFNLVISLPLFMIALKSKFDPTENYNLNLLMSLEKERQRISSYLHDEVLQNLIAVYHKDETNHQLASLISDIRNLSHDLYPIIVENLGLEQSLAIFIEDLTIDHNIDIDFKYLYPDGVIPDYIAVTIYRTVKELVINAVKHADCNKINVQISGVNKYINLLIEDNGKGFVVNEHSKIVKNPHMGLYTVKKQIENLKGHLSIKSNIGKGTRYDISIPLA